MCNSGLNPWEEACSEPRTRYHTLRAATLRRKVISNLSKCNSQQMTSGNILPTPLPYMFRPGLSLASLVSNYRNQCSSKNNEVSLLQYLCSVQWPRRMSLQGNCLFCHVAVNSIHLFSPQIKQKFYIGCLIWSETSIDRLCFLN